MPPLLFILNGLPERSNSVARVTAGAETLHDALGGEAHGGGAAPAVVDVARAQEDARHPVAAVALRTLAAAARTLGTVAGALILRPFKVARDQARLVAMDVSSMIARVIVCSSRSHAPEDHIN